MLRPRIQQLDGLQKCLCPGLVNSLAGGTAHTHPHEPSIRRVTVGVHTCRSFHAQVPSSQNYQYNATRRPPQGGPSVQFGSKQGRKYEGKETVNATFRSQDDQRFRRRNTRLGWKPQGGKSSQIDGPPMPPPEHQIGRGGRKKVNEREDSLLAQFPAPYQVTTPPVTSYSNPEYNAFMRHLAYLFDEESTSEVFRFAKLIAARGYGPTFEIYDFLIGSCAKTENGPALGTVALSLLEEMQKEKFVPTLKTYKNILKILSQSPDYLSREKILTQMREQWINPDADCQQYVLLGDLSSGQLERAMERYDELRKLGVKLQGPIYLEMIKALGRVNEVDAAIRVGKDMVEDRGASIASVASIVWYELLRVAAENYNLEGVMWVWRKAVITPLKALFNPDDGLCLAVLNTAARYGAKGIAVDVIRILNLRKIPLQEHHYAALISTLARCSDMPTAFRTLTSMRAAHITPTDTTAQGIADAITSAGNIEAVDSAYFVLKDLHDSGEKVDIAAFNSILKACTSLSDLSRALGVYRDSTALEVDPNTDTFNILFHGCSLESPPQKELAMFLASEMKDMGLSPSMITYEELLKVSLYQDDYEDAFTYLEEMKAAELGTVRPGVYRWIADRLFEKEDERLDILMDEMEQIGFTDELADFRLEKGIPEPGQRQVWDDSEGGYEPV